MGFFSYGYKLLEPFEQLENVKVASMLDIGLMKLDAVIGRGSRKDFFDLYVIAEQYPLDRIVASWGEKISHIPGFCIDGCRELYSI